MREPRMRGSELGLLILILLLLVIATWLQGCATFEQHCRWNERGRLTEQVTESTVVGTGETEFLGNRGCSAMSYTTSDTGLSNNGKDALGKVAEGAAQGAVGALVPSPGAVFR
ncbi:MAG: hypothetical protein L0191_06380 [Acidobacteria bacterium]|nr:hypothetical protein [Acidobacteriota bacterium]